MTQLHSFYFWYVHTAAHYEFFIELAKALTAAGSTLREGDKCAARDKVGTHGRASLRIHHSLRSPFRRLSTPQPRAQQVEQPIEKNERSTCRYMCMHLTRIPM
jgi:hypothetical protein